jgi:hypothetical protein
MNSAIKTTYSPSESHLAPVEQVIERGFATPDQKTICLETLDEVQAIWPSQKARCSQLRQALGSL